VRAEGNALFWNKVYDGALGWAGELSKFGAHVFQSDPHRLVTFGGNAARGSLGLRNRFASGMC
jgi:UDP-N-acetylglucosamine 1-carboxyvinyltransferase